MKTQMPEKNYWVRYQLQRKVFERVSNLLKNTPQLVKEIKLEVADAKTMANGILSHIIFFERESKIC